VRPELSILIPLFSQDDVNTTALCLQRIDSRLLEFVTINFVGHDNNWGNCFSEFTHLNISQINIPKVEYNRSLAVNIGIYFSHARRIFISSPRIVLEMDLLLRVMHLLDGGNFVTLRKLESSPRQDSQLGGSALSCAKLGFLKSVYLSTSIRTRWSDSIEITSQLAGKELIRGDLSGANFVGARKEHLIGIEGYNSDLKLWGWESADVQIRLKRTFGLMHTEVGHVELLPLVRRGPSEQELMKVAEANFRTLTSRYSRGDLRGTYRRDLEFWAKKIEFISSPWL
jgi:hypothetical protein